MADRKVHRVKRGRKPEKKRTESVDEELVRVSAELAKVKKDEPTIRSELQIIDYELEDLDQALKKLQVEEDGGGVDGGEIGKKKAKLKSAMRGKERLRVKVANKLNDILELEAREKSLKEKVKVAKAMGIPA